MRILLRVGVAFVLLLAGLAATGFWVLRPPTPLPLPDQGFELHDVTIINPGLDRATGQGVRVAGDSIEAIGPGDGQGSGPYRGMFVLPGLTDMHVHFPPASIPGQGELFSLLFLYHGITAVRDAGDLDGTATAPAREGIESGAFPGPRIQSCGPFVDGAPPRWGNTLLARNPEEGRRAVEQLSEQGFGCVKAYNGLDALTLQAIREAAAAHGVPVIGHVPQGIPYEVARLDDAQHLIGIPPPFPGEAPRFPLNLSRWADLTDERLGFMIAESLRHGIANTPTLITIDRLIHSEDQERILAEPDAQLLPRFYREVIWSPTGGTSAAGGLASRDFRMVAEAFEVMKRTLLRMHEAGVRLHTGTDSLVAFVVPGASLHRELRIWVDAGISPEQALAASMRTSAEFLGVPGLGMLRAGAPAEFLIFREDPTRDLAALDSLVAVVRDGRLYTREDLTVRLERQRSHFDSALYDAIVTRIVRRVLAATLPKSE